MKAISVVSAVLVGGLILTGAGCANSRSTAAYCAAMEKHKSRYLSAMDTATAAGGLGSLVQAAGAVGDLKVMWKDMAEAAPDDIRSDTEAVRDAWAKQEEAALSGNWKASLGGALANSGSMARVDAYVRQH